MTRATRLLAAALTAVASLTLPLGAQGDVILVRGGTIHTAAGAPINNGSVLIQAGKIVAVGTNVSAPAGARIIDATGKTVIPGMIDNHSHIGAKSTDLNDSPMLIGPQHRFLDALDWNDPDFQDAVEGGVTTIVTGPGSGENVSGMKAAVSAYTPNIPWARYGCTDAVRLNGGGTSSATPQVAAAVTLWFEKYKNELPRDWRRIEAVRNALFTTAKTTDNRSRLGNGVIQANAALAVRPVLGLPQAKSDNDSFAFLRVITGLGFAEAPPREQMLNLELMIVTRSRYDSAVGVFYPLASQVKGSASFDPTKLPEFGAIGAFGIQGVANGIANDLKMLAADGSYSLEKGKVYNLESSQFIARKEGPSGAHSDIAGPEVAHAIWSAALASA